MRYSCVHLLFVVEKCLSFYFISIAATNDDFVKHVLLIMIKIVNSYTILNYSSDFSPRKQIQNLYERKKQIRY